MEWPREIILAASGGGSEGICKRTRKKSLPQKSKKEHGGNIFNDNVKQHHIFERVKARTLRSLNNLVNAH